MKYIIQDWAGNVCFHGATFDSFDEADAWLTEKIEHIYPDTVDNEERFSEERGEYYIESKENI